MISAQPIIILLIFAASLISFAAGIRQLRVRQSAIARWSSLFLFGISLELICYLLIFSSRLPKFNIYLSVVQVICYLAVDVSFLCFVIYFTGHSSWISRGSLAIINIIPAITIGLLLFKAKNLPISLVPSAASFGLFSLRAPHLGLLEVFFVGFSFFVGISSLILLIQMVSNSNGFYRRSILVLIAGTLIVIAAGANEIRGSNPLSPLSILQAAVATNGISIFLVVFAWNTGSYIPFGRQAFIQTMQDGYLIFDAQDRVVDFNPAAQQILHLPIKIGLVITSTDLKIKLGLTGQISNPLVQNRESTWLIDLNGISYEVKESPIGNPNHQDVGRMMIFHKITRLETVEDELHDKNVELSRTNTFLTTLANLSIELHSTIEISQLFDILGSQLRSLGLSTFIALCDKNHDELEVSYLLQSSTFIKKLENLVGAQVIGYRLNREHFANLYKYLQTKKIYYLPDKKSGLSVYFDDQPNWILDFLLKNNVLIGELPSMLIPLITNDNIIGMMGVWGQNLLQVDTLPFQIFGSQVAWTIEKNQLYEAEKRRLEELKHSNSLITALSSVSSILETTRNMDIFLDTLGRELQKIGLNCAVVTLDENKEIATLIYVSFRPELIQLAEKISGISLKNYRIHRNLWPGVTAVQEKKPAWYSQPIDIFQQMFSKIPKTAIKKAFELLDFEEDDQICFLPLVTQDVVIGVMPIWGTNLKRSDGPALSVFCNQVAGILVSAKSFEEEAHWAQELARSNNFIVALSNVASQLDTLSNFSRMLSTLGQELIKLKMNSMVGLFDDAQENMKIEYISIGQNFSKLPKAIQKIWPDEMVIPRRLWPTDKAITDKKPLWDPQPIGQAYKMFPFLSKEVFNRSMALLGFDLSAPVCYLPMIVDEKVIGILAIWGKELREVDVMALSVFSNQVAIALKNTQLYHHAQNEIAERIEIESQIRKMLSEKEVLLKEIHHRVKNNLQVISSLLNLQAAQANDSTLTNALRESQNRLRAMALIHEKLYQSNDLAQVDFDIYLHSLVNSLVQTYRISSQKVVVDIQAEKILLDIDIAIPCGLILNELVTNSIKYAFPDEKKGTITILCYKQSENLVCLSVSDDGIGLPDGFEPGKPNSLGLKLVSSLVRQIQGALEMEVRQGAKIKISFPA